MFAMLLSFLRSFRVYFQSRADLQTEILAVRHQIIVLQRQTPKPKLKPADRQFWVALSQLWSRWRSALPNTLSRLNVRITANQRSVAGIAVHGGLQITLILKAFSP